MNDFSTNFRTFLKTQPAISDSIGVGPAARIFPGILRQGAAMPAIVFEEGDGGESYEYLNDPGTAGIARTIVHVYAYGSSRSQADVFGDTIRTTLQRARRVFFGDCFVSSVHVIGGRDHGEDLSKDKTDAHRYWTRRVYSIHHTEPIA